MTALLLPVLIYSFVFLLLFLIAELLHWKAGMDAEHTRKLVHVGTGLLTLGFPVYFSSSWQVIIICILFLAILFLSKKLGMLRSVNHVKRQTAGSILYPVIVILAFLFYKYMAKQQEQNYLNFYHPILIMAVCDPFAALIGNACKKSRQNDERKTHAGTLSFIILAFILSIPLLIAFTDLNTLTVIGWSAVLAILTGITERISTKGWDNFTIPLTAMAVLYLMNFWR